MATLSTNPTLNQFGLGLGILSPRSIYVRLNVYKDVAAGLHVADHIDLHFAFTTAASAPSIVTIPDGASTVVGNQIVNDDIGTFETLFIEIQQMEIMDWAPNQNMLANPATVWVFDPSNLNALCVRKACQK